MAEWAYHISLAVPDGDEARFLLLAEDGRWTLHALFTHLYVLPRAIRAQVGADMIVLRMLTGQTDGEAHVMQAMWLMENRTADWKPPEGGRWVDRAGLDAVTLADEWMRPALEQALDTLNEAPPAARPPWFQKGWFAQAEQWMTDNLTAQGYSLLRPRNNSSTARFPRCCGRKHRREMCFSKWRWHCRYLATSLN